MWYIKYADAGFFYADKQDVKVHGMPPVRYTSRITPYSRKHVYNPSRGYMDAYDQIYVTFSSRAVQR